MSEALTATLPAPASATARAWLDRLHALQELRAQFADAPDFQRWVIQARVLQFLLNTHAFDPWLDEHPSPSPIAEPYINLFAGAGKMPRTAEDIRPVLDAIAEGNRETTLRREAEARLDALERLRHQALAKAAADQLLVEHRVEELQARFALDCAAADAALDALQHRTGGPIDTAWDSADIAKGRWPLFWPKVPPDFVGLCIAGPLGDNTEDAVATILDFHLSCGRDSALTYVRQLQSAQPFVIATNKTTARWLAADLRGVGLQAMAST